MISNLCIVTFSCAVAAELTGICLLSPAPAAAQTKQQIEQCVERSNIYSADQQIAGCTALINSGRGTRQNLAIAHYIRGTTYGMKGDLDRAIADFNEAIKLNPKVAAAYVNRGKAYGDKGEIDRAIADYNKAIELNPKYSFAYNGRGHRYALKGQDDRAIADFNEAIKLNPKESDPYYNRGWIYFLQGATPKALADFTQANALNPKDAWAVLGLEITAKRSNLPSRPRSYASISAS
jgi:tetratricopeptide (TPR) repeat protein